MLALLSFSLALATRTWPVRDVDTLVQVLAQAEAGDTVELEPGQYVFSTPLAASQMAPLLIDKPLTLRSRDTRQKAVLVNDGASMLISVTASMVTIADLVVGAQRSGADERSIDVLVGAGTQTDPAGSRAYYNNNAKRSALASSRTEIVVARGIHTAQGAAANFRKRSDAVSAEGAMRVLHDVKLQNVDFSASRSGANVGFARGSYSSVSIGGCVFGRESAPYINAIVAVGDAQFASLSVHGNTIRGGAHILIGSPAVDAESFALNFWGTNTPSVYLGGTRTTPETYCLNVECTSLAPVVDADKPNAAYATLGAAFRAGVRNVMVTDNLELTEPAVVTQQGTTLQSAASCNGVPLITVRAGGGIVSAGGALTGVRNIRLALAGPGAVGFVYTDGTAQRLNVARFAAGLLSLPAAQNQPQLSGVALFDGVSVMGDQSTDQAALLISAPKIRVEIEDAIMLQAQFGVVVHRGTLVSVDSTFFSADGDAIYAETTTHQAGLRVSGTTFIGCGGSAIHLGDGASSNTLNEFYVSCSQFLFNKRRLPIMAHDCAKLPTLCAANIKYNTFITDFPSPVGEADDANTVGAAERRMLKLGSNHIEHGRKRADYIYFGDVAHQFSLQDTQGRLSWVTGVLSGDALGSAFLLASYAPMRSECFEVDGVGPEAAVVSDVLEVRSDSMLHSCSSLAARFRIDDASSLPASLAVFGLAHLGTNSIWTAAVSTLHGAGADNRATIESSITVHSVADDKHTHRIVVVALETLPERLALALASGAATTNDAPRPIAKRLCVVCGGATLPAYLLDQFCAGTTDNVRDSFDTAYAELGFGVSTGAPRAYAASIYIYGTCETALCPVTLDKNENIEGSSITVRGTLTQSAQCTGQPLIRFSPRSSSASALRYVVAVSSNKNTVEIDAPLLASGATGSPSIFYSTLSTGVAIHSRNGGRLIGNDLGDGSAEYRLLVDNDAATKTDDALIIEANHFTAYDIVALDGAMELRVDRNTFREDGARVVSGPNAKLVLTANDGLAWLASDYAQMSALDNTLAVGAQVYLRASQTFVGSGQLLKRAQFTLDGTARLSSVHFDSASRVNVTASSFVVLRDVQFDSVGKSLVVQRPVASCAAFELATSGIDVGRSLITNGRGAQIFTADDQRRISGDATLFWAFDGTVDSCADGAEPVRTTGFCGCRAGVRRKATGLVSSPTPPQPTCFTGTAQCPFSDSLTLTSGCAPTDGSSASADICSTAHAVCQCNSASLCVLGPDVVQGGNITCASSTCTGASAAGTSCRCDLDALVCACIYDDNGQTVGGSTCFDVVPPPSVCLTPPKDISICPPAPSGFFTNSEGCFPDEGENICKATGGGSCQCNAVGVCNLGIDLITKQNITCTSLDCSTNPVGFGCLCNTDDLVCACLYQSTSTGVIAGASTCFATTPPVPEPTATCLAAPDFLCPPIQGFSGIVNHLGCEQISSNEMCLLNKETAGVCQCQASELCFLGNDLQTHAPITCVSSNCTASGAGIGTGCICDIDFCACQYEAPNGTEGAVICNAPPQICLTGSDACPPPPAGATLLSNGCESTIDTNVLSDICSVPGGNVCVCSAVGVCLLGIDIFTHANVTCGSLECTSVGRSCSSCNADDEACTCIYAIDSQAAGISACFAPTTTTTAITTTTTTAPTTAPVASSQNNTALIVGLSVLAGLVIICTILACAIYFSRSRQASINALQARSVAHAQASSVYVTPSVASASDALGPYTLTKRHVAAAKNTD